MGLNLKKYKKLKSKNIANDAVETTSEANKSIYKKLLEEKKQKVEELETKLNQVKCNDEKQRIQMAKDNINQLIERESFEANIKSKFGYDFKLPSKFAKRRLVHVRSVAL